MLAVKTLRNLLRARPDVADRVEPPSDEILSQPTASFSGSAVEAVVGQPANRFCAAYPVKQNALSLFEGEWSSAVPGYIAGDASLFQDERIPWFEAQLGSLLGLRVLELGSFECGHTYMMAQRGALVTGIETNVRAWQRGLAIKEVLGIPNSNLLLGDFVAYIEQPSEKYDFLLASGVLYHMTEPVKFLRDISGFADRIGIWTHYFDRERLALLYPGDRKFTTEPERMTTEVGRVVELYGQRYLEAAQWDGFCGSSNEGSKWMTRDGLLGVLNDLGYRTTIGFDHPDHPNGPSFCIYAERAGSARSSG